MAKDAISFTAAIASCEPVGRWRQMLDRTLLGPVVWDPLVWDPFEAVGSKCNRSYSWKCPSWTLLPVGPQ